MATKKHDTREKSVLDDKKKFGQTEADEKLSRMGNKPQGKKKPAEKPDRK